MTQIQENLMVKWLYGQLDDMDSRLLIPDFDPENLLYNLDCVDNMVLRQKPVLHSWDEFVSKVNCAE